VVHVNAVQCGGGKVRVAGHRSERISTFPARFVVADSKREWPLSVNRPSDPAGFAEYQPGNGKKSSVALTDRTVLAQCLEDLSFLKDGEAIFWSSQRKRLPAILYLDGLDGKKKSIDEGDWEVTAREGVLRGKGNGVFNAIGKISDGKTFVSCWLE